MIWCSFLFRVSLWGLATHLSVISSHVVKAVGLIHKQCACTNLWFITIFTPEFTFMLQNKLRGPSHHKYKQIKKTWLSWLIYSHLSLKHSLKNAGYHHLQSNFLALYHRCWTTWMFFNHWSVSHFGLTSCFFFFFFIWLLDFYMMFDLKPFVFFLSLFFIEPQWMSQGKEYSALCVISAQASLF